MTERKWQNGKLLPESERNQIAETVSQSAVKGLLITGIIFGILAVVLMMIGILYLKSFFGIFGIVIIPALICVSCFNDFLKKNRLRKMLRIGEFVFSREEIRNIYEETINGIKSVPIKNDLGVFRLTNEIIFIRKSADDDKVTYRFITRDKDMNPERSQQFSWHTSEELEQNCTEVLMQAIRMELGGEYAKIKLIPKEAGLGMKDNFLKLMLEKPEELNPPFLWGVAVCEGVQKIKIKQGTQQHSHPQICRIHAGGMDCYARDKGFSEGNPVLLMKRKDSEISAYQLNYEKI